MNEDKSPKVCPLLKQHCLESSCAWYMHGCRRCAMLVMGEAGEIATTTFLTDQLTCTTRYFASLFRLMRSLTLICQILLYVQVNSMIVGFNAEDRIVQSYLSSGIFTFNIKYAQFHYFSINKIEPFAPGTDPFTNKRLCSGITLIT